MILGDICGFNSDQNGIVELCVGFVNFWVLSKLLMSSLIFCMLQVYLKIFTCKSMEYWKCS